MGRVKDLYMEQCEKAYDIGYRHGHRGMPRSVYYMNKRDDAKGAYVDGYTEGQYFSIAVWKDKVCQN